MKDTKIGWEGLNEMKAETVMPEAPSVKKWEGLFNNNNSEE